MANWKELIKAEAKGDVIIACTLSEEELLFDFDDGSGCNEGECFTAWSNKYVYFPVICEGREWVGRTPRNPCDEETSHQGDL